METEISLEKIDAGKKFDWGKTSADYAKYRDIYPQEFYPVWVPEDYLEYFDLESQTEFRGDVPFSRDTWHGRIRACRGVGASMTEEEITLWEVDHRTMLADYPENFFIKHYVSVARLRKRKTKDCVRK